MRLFLLSLLFIFTSNISFGSHILGGEITATSDSIGDGIITLILYRDAEPGSAIAQPDYDLKTSGSTIKVYKISTDTISSSPIIIEKHIYQSDTVPNLASLSYIRFEECCRSELIENVINPQAKLIDITTFLYYSTSINSIDLPSVTPVFLGDPIVKFPKDTLWTYNPTAFDADGDSLFFRLAGNRIIDYSAPPAHPGGDLAIDSFSGEISWNASQKGVFLIGFEVEEWRDHDSIWVKAGEVYREMVIAVVADTSQLMVLPPSNVNHSSGIPVASFTGDSMNEIIIPFYSSDTNAVINMEAFGAPFQFNNSDAFFAISKFKKSTDTLAGIFSWTPQPQRKNNGPYLLTFRASDDNFSRDYTVMINVNSVIGLREQPFLTNDFFTIYPNPSAEQFHLELSKTISGGTAHLQLFDLAGQEVYKLEKVNLNPGERLSISPHLKEGIYLLKFSVGNTFQVETIQIR